MVGVGQGDKPGVELSQEMEKRLEPVHLVVVGHLVPPPPDVVRQEELVVSGITNQLKRVDRDRYRDQILDF